MTRARKSRNRKKATAAEIEAAKRDLCKALEFFNQPQNIRMAEKKHEVIEAIGKIKDDKARIVDANAPLAQSQRKWMTPEIISDFWRKQEKMQAAAVAFALPIEFRYRDPENNGKSRFVELGHRDMSLTDAFAAQARGRAALRHQYERALVSEQGPAQPTKSQIADAQEECARNLARIMRANPDRKTHKKSELYDLYAGKGPKSIPYLTLRAFSRAWDEATEAARAPKDSPWRRRGPVAKG